MCVSCIFAEIFSLNRLTRLNEFEFVQYRFSKLTNVATKLPCLTKLLCLQGIKQKTVITACCKAVAETMIGGSGA